MTKHQPWHQRKDENAKQFQAFTDYLNMRYDERFDKKRSTPVLGEYYRGNNAGLTLDSPPSLRQVTLEGWSSKFEWLKRVDAYDAYRVRQQQAAREKERDRLVNWTRDKARKNIEMINQRLDEVAQFTRGLEMETETRDGEKVLIPKSNIYAIRTLIRAARDAEEYARLVLDMPTDITENRNRDLGMDVLLKRIDDAKRDLDPD